jgi:hypothetical protein
MPVGDDFVLQNDDRHGSDTGSATTDSDAGRSVGERADNRAKHHQGEAASQHQGRPPATAVARPDRLSAERSL